ALLPVLLMLLSTVLQLITGHEDGKGINYLENFVYFIGTAGTAMMISVMFAIFSMGFWRGKRIEETMASVTNSIYPIGMMLLIIGGGGA
ncbi:gluconate permease, partial [Staphylococcus aureus]|nr:gluconate permease [Staphylococcus aureus]